MQLYIFTLSSKNKDEKNYKYMPKYMKDKTSLQIIPLCAVMFTGIFLFDISIPLGVDAYVPYVILVFISLMLPKRQFTIYAGIIGSILTVTGYYFSPYGGVLWIVIVNRLLALTVIWAAVFFSLKLRDIEEYKQAIVENVIDGVITISEKGIILTFNPASEKLFQYSADEVIGNNVNILMPEPFHSEHDRYINNYIHTGITKIIGINREVQGLRKDGSTFPFEIGISEVKRSKYRLFIGIIHDISNRKQTEAKLNRLNSELDEKNKELEQFINSTLHDLKSPLTTLKGFSEVLNNSLKKMKNTMTGAKIPPAAKNELLSIFENNMQTSILHINLGVSKMVKLIKGISEISKLGYVTFSKNSINMNQLMFDVKSTFEYQVKEKEINIVIEDLPVCKGDKDQLDRVFSNLFGNALKYLNPDRKGFIKITGKKESEKHIYCIEDNGIGIPKKFQSNIFTIFNRVNPKITDGEGLGLAIVNKIITRHGGNVWVGSAPDKGSKFFVSLPD